MDKDMNWRSYVEITHKKYITHYAIYARQNTNNYNKLEAELVTLMSAVKQAWERGAYRVVLDIENWLWSSGGKFLDLQGYRREGIELISQAVEATRLLGETFLEGRLLGHLGRVWLTLGSENLSTATIYFEQALKIAREVNDRQGISSHLGCLGQIYVEQRNKRNAIACFQEALKFAMEISNRQSEGRLLGSLGSAELIDSTKNAANKAIGYFDRAIKIARETGDRQGEASHLGYLGSIHEFFDFSPPVAPPSGQPSPVYWGPYPGENFGQYERLDRTNLTRYHKAIEYYQQALFIASEIDDSQLQERFQHDLARVRSQVS